MLLLSLICRKNGAAIVVRLSPSLKRWSPKMRTPGGGGSILCEDADGLITTYLFDRNLLTVVCLRGFSLNKLPDVHSSGDADVRYPEHFGEQDEDWCPDEQWTWRVDQVSLELP